MNKSLTQVFIHKLHDYIASEKRSIHTYIFHDNLLQTFRRTFRIFIQG